MQLAKEGGVSYAELGRMDIEEFFISLVNYEEELEAKKKAAKKALNSSRNKKRK